MSVPVSSSMTGDQHERLRQFLFPGDGKEPSRSSSAAGVKETAAIGLIVRAIEEIPYRVLLRTDGYPGNLAAGFIAPLLDRASAERLSVVKIHSHPTGYAAFSGTDDEGDQRLRR